MALPRYAVLQSEQTHKYVVYSNEDGEKRGLLGCNGDQMITPFSKLEFVRALTTPGYIHVRCSYNKKFWTRVSEDSYSIGARGDDIEEDNTKWNCTLFKPIVTLTDDDGGNTVQRIELVHVESGRQVVIPTNNNNVEDDDDSHLLSLVPPATTYSTHSSQPQSAYKVIDLDSRGILPMYLNFKGDNDKYLKGIVQQRLPYLQFSGDDGAEVGAMYQTFNNNNGTIRIKSLSSGKFWRNGKSWIWADTDERTSITNSDCWFNVFKININNNSNTNNMVALQSARGYGGHYFCKRLTADRKESCLNAYESTMTKFTRLEVNEPIISRKVYNIDYRLGDARIYNESVKGMATSKTINLGSEPTTNQVGFKYTETTSREWQATVSMKVGVEISFNAGVPFIADGGVKVSFEIGGSYTWGGSTTESVETSITQDVVVKPKTQAKVTLLATIGTCDVPFSYTQEDRLVNGTTNIQRLHDGLYTGANAYNFKAQVEEEIPITT